MIRVKQNFNLQSFSGQADAQITLKLFYKMENV